MGGYRLMKIFSGANQQSLQQYIKEWIEVNPKIIILDSFINNHRAIIWYTIEKPLAN